MSRLLRRSITILLTITVFLSGCGKTSREAPAVPETSTAAATLSPETAAAETVPPETEAAQKPAAIDEVPLYYQTDYPYIKFGYGTMSTSGCSVTCLAMVATYLTDQVYTPEQMAYHFDGKELNHVQRMNYSLEKMQLPHKVTYNVREVLADLKEGKVAIAMMNESSFFTDEQHFIVLAGINEDGRIIVNDPYEPNYTDASVHLKDAYDNGFEEYHLIQGFTGAWVFDKAAMPDEPFLFDASMPEQLQSRYTGYTLSEEDADTLTRFVMVEAGKETAEVQQAVAEVVLNRMYSDDYPYTIDKVIHQSELYRAVKSMTQIRELDPQTRAAVEAAVYGPYILPEDICFYSRWTEGQELWGDLEGMRFYKSR